MVDDTVPALDCAEVRELLGGFALRALEPEEDSAVRRHLEECELHEEAARLRGAAAALVHAAEPRPAPPRLRGRLLESIGADVAPAGSAPARFSPRGATAGGDATAGAPRRWLPYALAATFAIVALGLGIWGLTRDTGNETGTRSVSVVTETHHAQLIVIPHDGVTVLSVDGLEPPPPQRIYQVWLVQPASAPESVGELAVPDDARAALVLPREVTEGERLAITIEPAGGSPQPTTEPVLDIGF